MKPFELDLPATDEQMCYWLERQLVSGDLIDTVEKLHTLSGATEAKRILRDEALERRLDQAIDSLGQTVIDTGVSALSNEQIASLLRQPELLLALQDRVLSACSPYWDNFLASQTIAKQTTAEQQALAASNNQIIAPPLVTLSAVVPATPRGWRLPAAISSLCTAAAVLITVGLWQTWYTPVVVDQTACRWSIPELQKFNDGKQLFRQVALGATWPALPHSTAAELARDIANYRAKCSQMILADFAFLTPKEQTFLRDKCRLWAQKMDEQLVRLESQPGNDATLLLQVHTDMTTIITNLQKALRAA